MDANPYKSPEAHDEHAWKISPKVFGPKVLSSGLLAFVLAWALTGAVPFVLSEMIPGDGERLPPIWLYTHGCGSWELVRDHLLFTVSVGLVLWPLILRSRRRRHPATHC